MRRGAPTHALRSLFALCTAALWCFPGSAVDAQRPDLSGAWSVAPAEAGGRGGRAGDMGSGWGRSLAIAQDEATLTVQYDVYVRGDLQPPLRFRYALDGSETRNTVMMGRGIQERTSTTAWQGDTLVITTLFHMDEPDAPEAAPVEVRRRLWLETPAMLVVEATRPGVRGGRPTTTRTVYRR
jgi:hypothetical protein